MRDFRITETPGGVGSSFAPCFSVDVANVVLVAGAAQSITVPAGAKVVNFVATADFYVLPDGTAAVPAATAQAGANPVLNPATRSVIGIGALSLISADNCVVTAEFWSI